MARRRKSNNAGAGLLILFVAGTVIGFVRLWRMSPPLALCVLAVVLGGFAWIGSSGGAESTPYQPAATFSTAPQPATYGSSFAPASTPSPLAAPSPRVEPSAIVRSSSRAVAPLRVGTEGRASKRASSGGCGEGYYVNSGGECVPRPVRSSTAPAGASARCRDGTYSFSQNRRGTCSHHGGVASWL